MSSKNDGAFSYQALPLQYDVDGNQGLSINSTGPLPGGRCHQIQISYQVAPAVICAMCFVFGIVYTFFGYRFFKAVMFMTGFIFASLVTYLVCLEERLLPMEGKIGVALAAGILVGLITMLVQYVGLFLTGFHTGLLVACATLIVLEQFYHPTTKWIPIGLLFGLGLLFAMCNLYFQKGLTIFGTSIYGSALMVAALDYFIEMFMMVKYIWERIKAEKSQPVCWFSWIILGLWPAAFLVGCIAQWRVTGKGFDHQEVIRTRKRRKMDAQRSRAREHRESQHIRYRHLYQVRRCNGDVISQSYIQGIQHKLSPALRSLTQPLREQPFRELDSTNTTLTQVP